VEIFCTADIDVVLLLKVTQEITRLGYPSFPIKVDVIKTE